MIFIPDQLSRLLYIMSQYLLKQERTRYQKYLARSKVSDTAEIKVFRLESIE